ncbi:MAG: hypothetical protein JNM34_06190 [Chthonomonadaceae bacterium]|nr:hypothetical protein [Chthonomonadaceae bacterium]
MPTLNNVEKKLIQAGFWIEPAKSWKIVVKSVSKFWTWKTTWQVHSSFSQSLDEQPATRRDHASKV